MTTLLIVLPVVVLLGGSSWGYSRWRRQHLPNMADQKWRTGIHSYHGSEPFWP